MAKRSNSISIQSDSTLMLGWMFSLRNPKIFVSQIRRRYLTKEGPVLKFFHCLIWIKEPCIRKFEGLARSKILGISQTMFIKAAKNADSRFFEESYLYRRSNQHFSTLWILKQNFMPDVRENHTKCKFLIFSSVISNLGNSLFIVLHKCPFTTNTWGAQFLFLIWYCITTLFSSKAKQLVFKPKGSEFEPHLMHPH